MTHHRRKDVTRNRPDPGGESSWPRAAAMLCGPSGEDYSVCWRQGPHCPLKAWYPHTHLTEQSLFIIKSLGPPAPRSPGGYLGPSAPTCLAAGPGLDLTCPPEVSLAHWSVGSASQRHPGAVAPHPGRPGVGSPGPEKVKGCRAGKDWFEIRKRTGAGRQESRREASPTLRFYLP